MSAHSARKAGLGGKASEKNEAAVQRERMRIAATEREYAVKLDDLRHNYALSVKVEWVQGLVLIAPVLRHRLLVKRRKGERMIEIDWHPGVRLMEPAPCDWGDGLAAERIVCDEHLHPTDPTGQAPCAACRKPFRRAGHCDACPKCGTPVGEFRAPESQCTDLRWRSLRFLRGTANTSWLQQS